jgi:hypothetical protein
LDIYWILINVQKSKIQNYVFLVTEKNSEIWNFQTTAKSGNRLIIKNLSFFAKKQRTDIFGHFYGQK